MLVRKSSRSISGFTYLAVMFAVFLVGLSLTVAAQQWKTVMKREKEAELLFRGDQFRTAIAYYHRSFKKYPRRLEDLLKAPDTSATKRFLRKVYQDPMTDVPWGLVKMGDRIKGVYSQSGEEPLKKGNFPRGYEFFEGKTQYRDWVFEFTPQKQPQTKTKQAQKKKVQPQQPQATVRSTPKGNTR